MAWYDDKKRKVYVAEYDDADAINDDAEKAAKRGWTIQSTSESDEKVRAGRTIAKGILTGGVGLLLFGRSKKGGKPIVTWVREDD